MLARLILRLYPRRWRARYEDEALSLIEDAGLSPLAAVDLIAGALLEHARAVLVSATHLLAMAPDDVRALSLSLRIGLLTAVMLLPVAFVLALRLAAIAASRWLFTIPTALRADSILIFTTIYLAGQVRLAFLRVRRPGHGDGQFLQDLDRYPLPRINRAFAVLTHRLVPADPFMMARPARFRPAEAVAWLVAVAAAFLLVEWGAAGPNASGLPMVPAEITFSICATGFFVSVLLASVAYQRAPR